MNKLIKTTSPHTKQNNSLAILMCKTCLTEFYTGDVCNCITIDKSSWEVVEVQKSTCPANKYMREIKKGVWVDVYDVINAFEVTDAGMQHALKKILATGKRGHKTEEEDRKDILASIIRSNEIFKETQSR